MSAATVLSRLFLVWVVVAPLTTIKLVTVRSSAITVTVAALVVVLAAAALVAYRDPDRVPWRSRLLLPLLALGAAAAIAALQGALLYDPQVLGRHRFALVQIYALALIEMSLATALAVAILIRDDDDVRWLRRAVVAAAVLLLARPLARGVPLPSLSWWPMAAAHGLSLALAWLLFERSRWWSRLAAATLVAAIVTRVTIVPFFADVSSQWLSGWIVTSVPIGLLVLARFPRTTLAIAVPVAVGFFAWNFGLVQRAVDLADKEGDFMRLLLWKDALELALRRPLFGVGPGNYLDYSLHYGGITRVMSSPHGNYQQLAAETGLIGLGFALWLFLRALALGWSLFRHSNDALIRSTAIGAAAAVAAQLAAAVVGDFVLPSYHNGGYVLIAATIYAWVSIGMLLSLERLDKKKRPS